LRRVGIVASAHAPDEGGGDPIEGAFWQSATNSADLTIYTFSAQPIGTAAEGRRVVVGIGTNSTRTVSSVTIGGVSASIDATHFVSGDGRVAIASAVVPTGTTADVVVTLDSGALGCGIGVWTLTGGAPTGHVDSGGGDPIGLDVSTAAGDVVIAYVAGIANQVFTWTGATERFEEDLYSTTTAHAGADVVAVGALTSFSVNPAASDMVAVAAGYR
jgi:hypothetical protein